MTALPVEVPSLPGYLPQLRFRHAFDGYLREPIYAIRADDVIGTSVVAATTVRARVGLRQDQMLVLLLFDEDDILERLWREGRSLFPQIAAAGYNLVVAPSYSAWLPRPRPDFLTSAKRSLVAFEVLQRLHVTAIPRLVWVIEHDVRRAASWVRQNSAVELIGLDLQTYTKNPKAFAEQLDGLRLFDRLTRRHLHYLINGPRSEGPVAAVFAAVPDRRVCITNATAAGPFEDTSGPSQLALGMHGRDPVGVTFAPRCRQRRDAIRRAADSARSTRRSARGVKK